MFIQAILISCLLCDCPFWLGWSAGPWFGTGHHGLGEMAYSYHIQHSPSRHCHTGTPWRSGATTVAHKNALFFFEPLPSAARRLLGMLGLASPIECKTKVARYQHILTISFLIYCSLGLGNQTWHSPKIVLGDTRLRQTFAFLYWRMAGKRWKPKPCILVVKVHSSLLFCSLHALVNAQLFNFDYYVTNGQCERAVVPVC